VNTGTLGQRLANSWLDEHYRTRGNTSGLVYTKAPQIIRAFDKGAVTRSRRGRFPVISTEKRTEEGNHGRQIRPSTFSEHGLDRSDFVPRPSGPHYSWPTDCIMKRQTAYGQARAATTSECPSTVANRRGKQGLTDDPVLGQGRDFVGGRRMRSTTRATSSCRSTLTTSLGKLERHF
jgi:hypothetical protein